MKVFVSSVVDGFESFRAAARRAVETIDGTPIMCEDFGARPHSSERACLTEVESSDVLIVILGERYGFEQSEGVSVTQQEFRQAIGIPIRVLVFIQDVSMEPKQFAFRAEVESYHSGFCRELFSTPEELKDKLIQNLLRLSRTCSAITEAEFERRIEDAATQGHGWSGSPNEATFSFAFLPQPRKDLDLRGLVSGRNRTFALLSELGLASMQNGYDTIDERDHTGLKSRNTIVRQYDDGLFTLETSVTVQAPGISFASWYVPPSRVLSMGQSCFHLIQANGGWCRIGLKGMEMAVMTELPTTPSNSFSLANRGEKEGGQNKLLIPCTQSAYEAWLDTAVARLERQFGPR